MKPNATDLIQALSMFRAAPYDAITVFADDLHQQLPPEWCVTSATTLEYNDHNSRYAIVVDQTHGLITCRPTTVPRSRLQIHIYDIEPTIVAAAAVARRTKGPQYDYSLRIAYLTCRHTPNIFVLQFTDRGAWCAYTGDLIRWINANMCPNQAYN